MDEVDEAAWVEHVPVAPSLATNYKHERYEMCLALVERNVTRNPNGCWIWNGYINTSGYAITGGGTNGVRNNHLVHRIVVEATHEKPLGSQQAHHKCAVRACVNPDHLQPVTAYENIAEMLARGAFVKRIVELEAVIREVDPGNEALRRVPYGIETSTGDYR